MQSASCHEVKNVAIGRVLRTPGDLRPLRCRELAFEAVQQPVQHLDLPLVQRLPGETRPEVRLVEDDTEGFLGTFNRALKTIQKPLLPLGNVELALLRPFKRRVVHRALTADLRRHAVEALRGLL